jgi:hypothetical protein
MHVLLILNVYCQFTDPTGWNSGLVIDYYWNNMHKKQEKKQQRGIIQEWKTPGGGGEDWLLQLQARMEFKH